VQLTKEEDSGRSKIAGLVTWNRQVRYGSTVPSRVSLYAPNLHYTLSNLPPRVGST
jgi:hypothetical protein